MSSVRPQDLEKSIFAILDDYKITVEDQLNAASDKVGKQTVDTLKATSPRGKGKYAKGWKLKRVQTGGGRYKVVVYNSNYQLTHLLEYGHATRTGGRTKAMPHIKPAEDAAAAEFESEVKIIVGKTK